MKTVVEFREFINEAEKIFGAEEREKIVSFPSLNPKAGKKQEHFGGIRKPNWNDDSAYGIYFHPGSNDLPLVIISIFRKHEKIVLEKIIEILIRSKTRRGT
ncbi:MAG TPA: hypothetical protein VIL74_04315 [Pyrinomonadaceae bacterium]|jgi:endonuclease IV